MDISLNPSYFCNFRCSFCYLTEQQLANKNRIDLTILDNLLTQVPQIDNIDLYGGEVSLLDESYWYEMKSIIRKYYSGPINVITNLSRTYKPFLDDDITLSVSYDFDCRQAHQTVFNNISYLPKQVSILLLASKCLIEKNVDEMIMILNALSNIVSVEIKPYSTNQANQDQVTFSDYEEFVKKWLESPIEKNFIFVNEEKILDVLDGLSNSFSDNHVYITPSGKFGVLEFDEKDNEFFLELSSYNDYIEWATLEKNRVWSNSFCNTCKYSGKCLSEHLRNVTSLTNSCNGFKNLLDWYDERMEA